MPNPPAGKERAPLAQLVEQLTLNQRVVGSSPTRCNLSNTGRLQLPPDAAGLIFALMERYQESVYLWVGLVVHVVYPDFSPVDEDSHKRRETSPRDARTCPSMSRCRCQYHTYGTCHDPGKSNNQPEDLPPIEKKESPHAGIPIVPRRFSVRRIVDEESPAQIAEEPFQQSRDGFLPTASVFRRGQRTAELSPHGHHWPGNLSFLVIRICFLLILRRSGPVSQSVTLASHASRSPLSFWKTRS